MRADVRKGSSELDGLRVAAGTLLSLVISLFLASVIIFFVLRMLPGDASATLLGVGTTEEQLDQLRDELGANEPLVVQYAQWLKDFVTGSSVSLISGSSFGELVTQRASITVPLSLMAFTIAVLVSLPLGIVSATKRTSALGAFVSATSQVGVAVPIFWVGILLISIFSLQLGWLPAGTFPRRGWDDPGEALRALILPALTIAIAMSAVMVRYVRSSVLDVLETDYMRTAQSLGYSQSRALLRHGLRNAAVPVVAILGIELGTSLLGAVVVENVFGLGGLGQLLLSSVTSRDLPIIQNLVLLLTAVVLIINALVEILQQWLDPCLRVPHGRRRRLRVSKSQVGA